MCAASESKNPSDNSKKAPKNQFSLSTEEKEFLIKIARETLESYVKNKKIPKFKIPFDTLKSNAGAFVTLNKNHQLRGCIGDILPRKPLFQSVIDNAVNSCSTDPRFPPVTLAELKDIHVEITVLSPPVKVDSYKDIIIGKHGVILRKGYNGAVFLPQVATEQGWDLETTLTYLSRKAGLSPDGWKKGATFEIFTGIIIKE